MLLFCSRFYLPLEKTTDILLSSRFFCFIWEKKNNNNKKHDCNITKLIVRIFNYAFYLIRSPGESMTEILFPSRLSNVKSYHSFIIWAVSGQSDCASSEDSDQPGHPPSLIRVFAVPDQPGHPPSLIRVFAVRMRKAWVFSYPLSAQRRLWSDWADAGPIWVFAGRTVTLLVLSWDGSFVT